jgi:glyoxylase-like metal-dependent hydrolase (beta-lactamase superfamily II)
MFMVLQSGSGFMTRNKIGGPRMNIAALKAIIAGLIIVCGLTSCAQRSHPDVERIGDGVFLYRSEDQRSLFLVTDDGVIVTDPINAEAAAWLRTEIAKLTEQPITHLIYSHSHGDHASGGAAYGKLPNIIAQQNAPPAIDGVMPTIRFSEQMSFTRGDKTFELTYLGPGHGNDLMAIVVRPDNVAFVVDAVSSKRLFYRDFPGANIDHWIDQVRKIDTLEFEIMIGGHGPVGVKSDVADGIAYLEALRAAVLQGLNDGKSVDELRQSVKMEKYKTWAAYDQWRELNVQGMARYLTESGAIQ